MTQPPPKEPGQTRRELASELVHSIMKDKVEERDRQRGQTQTQDQVGRRERMRRILVFGLLPAFLLLLGWNLTRGGTPPQVFTPAELDAGSRFKIYLAAQALKAYRDSAGAWPASLDAVGFGNEGLAYEVVDTTYVIQATVGGAPVFYRSGDDLAFFRDASRELVR
ncbi:MAG TPA: hypothetical protein VD707_01175 [Gemmatimonadales bacterium]|jgi:hypothetical protein|nr:hypothetical protein [Gemmatimonadales bacterium]